MNKCIFYMVVPKRITFPYEIEHKGIRYKLSERFLLTLPSLKITNINLDYDKILQLGESD